MDGGIKEILLMLKLNLSPVNMNSKPLNVFWEHPKLIVNGVIYNLSDLPDGATATHPVLQHVSRTGADYEVTLILPHGDNAPHATRFPEPIVVTADGQVTLPPYTRGN